MSDSNRRKELIIERIDVDGVDMVMIGVPALRVDDPRLSGGEREVVESALAGFSNQEIARQRGVSIRTIGNQLRSAYRKLGVNSRFELAAQLGRRSSP